MANANAIEAVKQYFRDEDQFAAANGIELLELEQGRARARLVLGDRHRNCFDLTHGGALFTLAAVAFAAASNSAGRMALGVSLNLSCLKSTRGGTLHAEAVEASRSRRLSVCAVRVTDDTGELVALLHGTAYIQDKPFPPESAKKP